MKTMIVLIKECFYSTFVIHDSLNTNNYFSITPSRYLPCHAMPCRAMLCHHPKSPEQAPFENTKEWLVKEGD
jgi:hypothetical protein